MTHDEFQNALRKAGEALQASVIGAYRIYARQTGDLMDRAERHARAEPELFRHAAAAETERMLRRMQEAIAEIEERS